MAINGRTNTLFCQNVPTVRLKGDQSYVYNDSDACFVQADQSCCDETTNEVVETINCYSAVADGNTTGFIIPWEAPNEQSLYITLDGIKQYDDAYKITVNKDKGFTLVTFAQAPTNGTEIEIFGFIVSNPDRIKRYQETSSGLTTNITIPWTANSTESLIISVDGVKQLSDAYSLSYNNSGYTVITFSQAIPDNSDVEIIGLLGFAANTFKRFEDTGNGVTTTYTIPWYAIDCGSLIITIGGVKQHVDAYDVTPTSSTTTDVTFVSAPGNGDDIEILGMTGFDLDIDKEAEVVGNNLGTGGFGIYNSVDVNDNITTLNFRSLVAGAGITITSGTDLITIESDSVNTYQNIGSGSEVLVEPVSGTIDFRTLLAGSGIGLTQNANDITIEATGDVNTLGGFDATDYARTINNVGSGTSLIKKGTAATDSTFELYSLKAGSGIVVHRVGDDVYIADANGGNYVGVVSDYNVERDDRVVGVQDTSVQRTITLPPVSTSGPGKFVTVKDETGTASLNNIIVNTSGSDNIDGSNNIIISNNYGKVTVYTNGTDWFTV